MSDQQSQHALPIGYQLHWFQIESILGVGGSGITCLARDGDKRGPWTGIYALGATLYRAVTGKGPVDALTRARAILKGHKDVLVSDARDGRRPLFGKFSARHRWCARLSARGAPADHRRVARHVRD